MISIIRVFITVSALSIIVPCAGAHVGYYRWPTGDADVLVFSSEGDLWRLDSGAAQAVRLTTHEELESEAVLSPDGRRIAFRASFDGIPQAYVMGVEGGPPTQVTFESVPVNVRGWSPDGRILYSSQNMEGSSRARELRLVDPDTTRVERIPLRYATTGTFSDDGSVLYFTRYGIGTVNDSARLYRGGGMSQLWRFEMNGSAEAERLAAGFSGPIEDPMFWNGRIYFISDESGYDNIWSMDSGGGDIRRHSEFSGWRLRGANLGDGTVYYQRGADLFTFDISSGRERAISIDLAGDRDRRRLRWIEDPLDYLDDARLGGDGDHVALTSRGRVALATTGGGRRVELPVPGEARLRSAVPGPDDWVYAIVDEGDGGEIWRFASDGGTRSEQLTDNAGQRRWRLNVSPDGKWLIHDDMSARLWKLDLETMENTLVMESNSGEDDDFGDIAFSPGDRYLAFRTTGARPTGTVIVVHDLESGENVQVTPDRYSSGAPAFSRDGEWLYFLSERNFQPFPASPWGDRNMGVAFEERVQLFALALDPEAVFPFAEPNELTETDDEEDADEGDDSSDDDEDADEGDDSRDDDEDDESDDDDEEAVPAPEIDWEAAAGRLYQVPIPAGNYAALKASEDRLFLLDSGEGPPTLKSLAIGHDDPELEDFASGVAFYELSDDGTKLFYRTGGGTPTLAIVPVGDEAPDDLDDYRLHTEGWRVSIDPAVEWRQMFLDGWRMHRDFAFDPDMRGVDWEAVRERLLPLTERIGHRTELSDLLGEMASEIGILHSQVTGGDIPDDDESGALASLGARYEPLDGGLEDGGLEIVQIYQGERERPSTLGPLDQPEVDVRTGDVIVAVNRRPVRTRSDLERSLMFQAGEQVLLETERAGETIENVVTPVSLNAESMLRYLDWTGANARVVAEASDGEIGYLHLRAMGADDLGSFARDFFAQNHLDGLIVDVRDNNGGNIDSTIITQFLRRAWAFWEFESGGPAYPNMQEAFRGHLAVLINAGTYSDGESFAAGIKALELAPLIGERTAGAGIWLTDRNRLADGGMSRIAEIPQFGLDGRWLIEGEGIAPDIEVVAEPRAAFNGDDQQLQAAIEYLRGKIAEEPVPELRGEPLPPVGGRGRDVRE